ncbi:GGDEF domain-containing protein [Neisseriaceae bacterium JH1-16]|nr:GGDEF domain-containing protein [Neisseriaceae bacterium JH1-16]
MSQSPALSLLFVELRRGALSASWRRTLTGLIAFAQLATLLGHLYNLPSLAEPFSAPLSVLAEVGIYLMVLLILIAMQPLSFLPYTYSLLTAGLGLWLETALIDVLDKVLVQPSWISGAGRDWLRLSGLLLVTLGVFRLVRQLRGQMQRLNELATLDELTRLYNRRYLLAQAQRWLKPGASGLTLIMFDIDRFKQVNDNFGHAVGDQTLQDVTRLVGMELPPGALLGRLGGEEFAILLPSWDVEAGRSLAEQCRVRLADSTTAAGTITASFGVTGQQPADASFEALLRRADRGLYDAKDAGRNRVCIA